MGEKYTGRKRRFKKGISRMLVFLMIFGIISSSLLIPQTASAEGTEYVYGPNLITNPGFEEDLTGWKNTVTTAKIEVDNTVSHSGDKSLKMTVEAGQRGMTEWLHAPVDPQYNYTLRGYIKTDDWKDAPGRTAQATLEIYYCDSNKVFINKKSGPYTNAYIRVIVPLGTYDWTYFEVPVLPLSYYPEARYARLILNSNNGTGTVWFDDVSFCTVTDPRKLESINVTAGKTDLKAGEIIDLDITGTLADGSTDLSGVALAYASSNPSVVEAENGKVYAMGEGTAVVTVSDALNAGGAQDSIEFNVTCDLENVLYDFKKPIGDPYGKNWWKVDKCDGNYRNQEYGIQVLTDQVNEYIQIRLNVPRNGFYTPIFTGAGAGGGAFAELFLDDVYIGMTDFYSGVYIKEKDPIYMKTMYLTQGAHDLKIKAVGMPAGSWGYNMYPGRLELIKKEGLPLISEVIADTSLTNIAVGQTTAISAQCLMSDGYIDMLRNNDAVIEYSSSNTSVAVVDAGGVIRGVSPGSADITVRVTLNESTGEDVIPITVNSNYLNNVELTIDKPEIPAGHSTGTTIAAYYNDGSQVNLENAEISYSSDNINIAVVDADGIITGISEGSTNINAAVTHGGVSVTASAVIFIVPVRLESVEITVNRTNLFPGDTARISVSGLMNDGSPADMTSGASITYSSSDPSVIEAGSDGIITAKKEGTAEVTSVVTMGGITKTANPVKVTVNPVVAKKTRSTIYTPEKVAAARANIEKYDWARSMRDGIVPKAEEIVGYGHDFLWDSVAPQSIPRAWTVNVSGMCLNCGEDLKEFGEYPYIADPVNKPWKLKCPSCSMEFPTNDFEAYYKSGIDENGIFDPSLADRSLLKNTSYPEKGETWGVDDGYGYVDGSGKRWPFIAVYNHWFNWYGGTAIIQNALTALRDAYLYTGDPDYAAAGIILLDRIADVYPSMTLEAYKRENGYENSHGGTGKGKIIGCIWETNLVKLFVSAYDALFPAFSDPEVEAQVLEFFRNKSQSYSLGGLKTSMQGIRANIESGIICQVYPGVMDAHIRGNNGMHQSALAMAAVVYDTLPETKEWLDFNMQAGALVSNPWRVTGGNILATFVDDVDRDGHGNEASPQYNSYWLSTYLETAEVLKGYDKYPDADLYKNVKFRNMFFAQHPLLLSNIYTPNIGDSGFTGNPVTYLDRNAFIKAFEAYRDPELAKVIYFLNGSTVDGLIGDIFSENPEQIAMDIKAVIEEHGTLNLSSLQQTGYGISILRDGTPAKPYGGMTYSFISMVPSANNKEYKLFSNGALQLEASAIGDFIEFNFDAPKDSEYEISLIPHRANSYGKYDIFIDGTKIKTMDFSGTGRQEELIGTVALNKGTHSLKFECVAAGPASGFKLGLVQLILLDEEARTIRDNNPPDTQRDLYMYYGKTGGHGHLDALNIGLHAYGLDLAPDLGYPEYANDSDTHRHEWVRQPISHNTVLVDKKPQAQQLAPSKPLHFDDSDMVQLIDVESPGAYPGLVDDYRRTTAMIKVDEENSYIVDFFRIKGGSDHHFSFHGAEGPVTTDGLSLEKQADGNGDYIGSYAGPDVPYGQKENDKGSGWSYQGSGFHYLKNVERDSNPAEQFSVDWDVTDTWKVLNNPEDIHLRLTMMGDFNEVALADGIPPQNKGGNPKSLRYMIAHRKGTNLDSIFTSVIEPYKASRYIESISPVSVTNGGTEAGETEAKAVKVVLTNGRTDYIISTNNNTTEYLIDGKFQFKGYFGVYSERNGIFSSAYINDGSKLGNVFNGRIAGLAGKVDSFTQELSVSNEITVDIDLQGIPVNDLVGRYIYIENDGIGNACYEITGIKRVNGSLITFDIGSKTLIRSWKDKYDFSRGYVYDIAAGNDVYIPLSAARTADYSGGDDSGDDDTKPQPAGPVTAKLEGINITAKKDTSGNITVKVESNVIQEAFEKTEAGEDGGKTVTLEIPSSQTGGYEIELPAEVVTAPDSSRNVAVKTGTAEVLLPGNMLTGTEYENASSVRISIGNADKSSLPDDVAESIGDRPVIQLSIAVDGQKKEWSNPDAKVTVSIPYTPTEEELKNPEHITVWYVDGNGNVIPVTSGRYNPETGMVTFETNHFSNYAVAYVQKTFKDLSRHIWAKREIEVLASKGIIEGTSLDEFSPGNRITRADYLTLLVRALGLSAKFDSNFDDVQKGKHYYEAIGIAKQLGITEGTGGNRFMPEAPISRQDMMVLTAKALQKASLLKVEGAAGDLSRFTDKQNVADYAVSSVAALVEAKLIEGDGGRINPRDNTTRAEAAVFLYRIYTAAAK